MNFVLSQCKKKGWIKDYNSSVQKKVLVNENDFVISRRDIKPCHLPKKFYRKSFRTKKNCSKLFAGLKKTKRGLFLPVLLSTMKGDHPTKKGSYVYLDVETRKITIISPHKRTVKSFLWISRLITLYG
jgi:hypothetical protein